MSYQTGARGALSHLLLAGIAAVGVLALLEQRRRRSGEHIAASARAGAPGGTAPSGAAPESAATWRSHGRDAASPSEITPRGWADILLRVAREFSRDRILSEAAGVTFYALLAVFPALAAFISLYGLFFDPGDVRAQLATASWVLPGGAIAVLGDQATRIAAQGSSALGFGFFFGLAIALWSANAGTKAVIAALNVAYEEKERRGFLALNALSLVFTLGGLMFAVLALAAIVAIPVVLKFVYLGATTEWLLVVLRWPAIALVIALSVALLYRFGPCRDQPRWRWVSWGSITAALLWLGVSGLFSWYVAQFGSYDRTYGSLGAVIGFMTWIWLSVSVVLLGAELNAEMEHQTAVDTTTGPPEPMGMRGARMADTLGRKAPARLF